MSHNRVRVLDRSITLRANPVRAMTFWQVSPWLCTTSLRYMKLSSISPLTWTNLQTSWLWACWSETHEDHAALASWVVDFQQLCEDYSINCIIPQWPWTLDLFLSTQLQIGYETLLPYICYNCPGAIKVQTTYLWYTLQLPSKHLFHKHFIESSSLLLSSDHSSHTSMSVWCTGWSKKMLPIPNYCHFQEN